MSAPLAECCTAMILAAGLGTRLSPLTDDRAKVVVPFLNRPLLDYTLDWLRRCGFRRVVINLHYLPDTVRERYRDGAFGLELDFSLEDRILGTGGGPRKVIDRLGERVLIVNGDVATTIAVGVLWTHHREASALATMGLHAGAAAGEHPGIEIDGSGLVTHIPGVGRGVSTTTPAGCFTGIHIVEREVIELVPEHTFCGIVDPIYRALLDESLPLHGVVTPGSWYEIGTPARYLQCQLEALRREDFPLAFEGYRRVARGGYVRGVVGWMRAGLTPPFLLDRGVHIAEGALVEGVVAASRAEVGCGATVRDSVLLARSRVSAGAVVERCLVLEDAVVLPGARLADQVVSRETVAVST